MKLELLKQYLERIKLLFKDKNISFSKVKIKMNKKILSNILLSILVLSIISLGIGAGILYGFLMSVEPIPIEKISKVNLNSYVYDSEGNEIAKLSSRENREWVSSEQIPKYLKDAFVAIEDKRFYSHKGVDYLGFIRASIKKVFSPNSRPEGASTITMQLIRNITNERELSIPRKIEELWKAKLLEEQYNESGVSVEKAKDNILEAYLNIIYLGDVYGVKVAAQKYFSKEVKDLTLAECACLAGITQNPSKYAPSNSKGADENIKKHNVVLQYMREMNFISEDEYSKALKEKVNFVLDKPSNVKGSKQSYFVDYVINEIVKDLTNDGMKASIVKNSIYNGGWKIYTTLDPKVQNALDEVYNTPQMFPNQGNAYKETTQGDFKKFENSNYKIQSGMVVLDNSTAQIKGIYGGYGAKTADLTMNCATDINRNPGSVFKPIAVYGPAIDMKKINPSTIVVDEKVYLDPQNPTKPYPKNQNNTHRGAMTIKTAIQESNNIVAARIWKEMLDYKKVFNNYIKPSGFSLPNDKMIDGVSVALGGYIPANPLNIAASYVPFVNNGRYIEPTSYTKIVEVNDKGETLIKEKSIKNKSINVTQVYQQNSAYSMLVLLNQVCKSGGTASYLNILNSKNRKIECAGKTGTTDNDIDRWFAGSTPYYTGAVWYGDEDNRPLPVFDKNPAVMLWQEVMKKIHTPLEAKDFSKLKPNKYNEDWLYEEEEIKDDKKDNNIIDRFKNWFEDIENKRKDEENKKNSENQNKIETTKNNNQTKTPVITNSKTSNKIFTNTPMPQHTSIPTNPTN